jgi:3-hydroxybutyryl-CoA dehydrogenase
MPEEHPGAREAGASGEPRIETIAVIGAGAAGRLVAHAAAIGGYRTILEDILPTSLRKAEGAIRASLDERVTQGKLPQADADAAFRRIEYAGTVEQAARAADLVIECVPQELESKREIFLLLDKMCLPRTILVANTKEIGINEIASVTYRGDRCVGMRFDGERIEVIGGRETSAETLEAAVAVAKRLAREVAVRHDAARSVDAGNTVL